MKHVFFGAAMTALISLGSIAAAQQGQMQAVQGISAFTHPNSVPQDLARLDLALNNTGTLTGRFAQYGSDGSSAQGNLYLQRPGKIRFEYDAPNPMLIVSDGVTIMQTDRALGTADRIPLKSTPMDFFLKNQISLARDTEVMSLQRLQGETRVTVRDGKGQAAGEMTMVFNEPNLALTQWIVRDEFGVETRVQLSGLTYNDNINPRLFVLDNGRKDRRRRE